MLNNGLIALHMNIFECIEKKSGAAKGTLFSIFAVLCVKAIGAAYKIPLFNKLGTYGTGLYQMVFPVFSLVIALSSGGTAICLSKLIGEGGNANDILKKALMFFWFVGLIICIILVVFAKQISSLQGNKSLVVLYRVIAPAVLFINCIACFRGYFQGLCNMKTTACSQLIEQVVKAVIGLIAVYFVNGDLLFKATCACFAISFSELAALIYLIIEYKRFTNNQLNQAFIAKGEKIAFAKILQTILPLAAVSVLLPTASMVDSVICVNIIKSYASDRATSLFGLYSGACETLINLPVACLAPLCLGFVPSMHSPNRRELLLALNAFFSFLVFLFFLFFADFIVNLLFSGLNNGKLLACLLRVACVNVVFLSVLHASNSVLLSINRQKFSFYSLLIAIGIKIFLDYLLISKPQLNIFGLIISDSCCYFLSLAANLICFVFNNKKSKASNVLLITKEGKK